MSALTGKKIYWSVPLVVILVGALLAGCSSRADRERAAINGRVDSMLQDLRNGEVDEAFIEDYFDPDVASRISRSRYGARVVVAQMNKRKSTMVEKLNEVKNQEPEFSGDYTEAVYDSVQGEPAEFVKVEGTWYLGSVTDS